MFENTVFLPAWCACCVCLFFVLVSLVSRYFRAVQPCAFNKLLFFNPPVCICCGAEISTAIEVSSSFVASTLRRRHLVA